MTARHVQVLVFRLLVGAIVLACLVAATTTRGAEHALSPPVTPNMVAAPATVSFTAALECAVYPTGQPASPGWHSHALREPSNVGHTEGSERES
jgi:hypothetical protein